MKFHIVRNGETVKKIAFLYSLEVEEIKKENKHIRVWEKLIPGTKLKIPVITEAIDNDVTQMEPFVEDYYPKLNLNENIKDTINENQANFEEEYIEIQEDIYENSNENVDNTIKSTSVKQIHAEENINKIKADIDENIINEETTKIIKTDVNPIVVKNDNDDENNQNNSLGQQANVNQKQVNPYYYYPYYYQYPRYIYQPQYVYPVYIYPGRKY